MIETGAIILAQAERRVEIAAHNVANASTPGYKRRVAFGDLLAPDPAPTSTASRTVADLTAGKSISTGNPLDLSLFGDGFFVIRSGDQLLYTRQGQFARDAEGRLVTANGLAVQSTGGGDVVLRGGEVEVAANGIVMENGEPVAQLAVVDFADSSTLVPSDFGAFTTNAGPIEVEFPIIRQGMLEASNVSLGDEMVAMMAALRRAESGQRVVAVYDELMGRVLTTFGQG